MLALGLSALAAGFYAQNLSGNFDYIQRRSNGQVRVENRVKNEKGQIKISPKKIKLDLEDCSITGINEDFDRTLDRIEITRNFRGDSISLESLALLNSSVNPETLIKIYDEIMSSEEYKQTIEKRQNLGYGLTTYALTIGVIGLLASRLLRSYRLSKLTPEQRANPLYYLR